jgi:hypothetical protein
MEALHACSAATPLRRPLKDCPERPVQPAGKRRPWRCLPDSGRARLLLGLPKEINKPTGEAAMKLGFGSTALVLGLGLGLHLSGSAAAQQVQFACDQNGDGSVDATESRLCTDREFDEIAPGETALTEEQLFAKMTGKGVAPSFGEIDQNGDGQISRAEWSDFSAQGFAGATEASGGKMTSEDYAKWREQGRYVRPAQ